MPALRGLLVLAGWTPRDVRAVYFSQGPGSFTGLRIAATAARMFQWALGCDVVAVPTSAVVARCAAMRAADGGNDDLMPDGPLRVAVILDAGRGQVHGALHEVGRDGAVRTIQDAAVRDAAAWLGSIAPPFCVTGEGVAAHREACLASGAAIVDQRYWTPTVDDVLSIGFRMLCAGRVCRPEQIVPFYGRPPEAEEVYERRRAAARARRGG